MPGGIIGKHNPIYVDVERINQFLAAKARRVCKHISEGLDVYAFFNNDAEGHAVRNALTLREYIVRHIGGNKAMPPADGHKRRR